jgi:DNA-binding protein HU-beta
LKGQQSFTRRGSNVNKAELIEALSGRLGDRKTATAALDAVLAEIQNAVTKGDKVSITGFGVFEKRVRAARTARNPRTGESVKVKKTSVPAFRPGASFKELVAAGKVPKATKAAAPAKRVATKAPAKTATKVATKVATKAAKKAGPAKKVARATSTTPRATATARATTARAAAAPKAVAARATVAPETPAKATRTARTTRAK